MTAKLAFLAATPAGQPGITFQEPNSAPGV
jgi:hypothetical protein